MNHRPVGIGIIGTGFGATVQLPGFLGLPGARVVGIVGRDAEESRKLCETHSLPRSFATAEELCACEDVDLVSVTVPPFAQEPLVRRAIAAKKAVLCEKPFTMNAVTARSLLNEATRANIFHAVDFEFRDLPSWQVLKAEIDRGTIGKITHTEFRWMVGSWADPLRPWHWQCDAAMGGGIISTLGTHLFDAAEWFLGPMKTVRGNGTIAIKERPDPVTKKPRPVTAEDCAEIALKGADGVRVSIFLSNVEKRPTGLTMEFCGERGVLRLESDVPQYGRGHRVLLTIGSESKVLLEPENIPESIDARIPLFQKFAARLVRAVSLRDSAFHPSFVEGVRSQVLRDAAVASKGDTLNVPL